MWTSSGQKTVFAFIRILVIFMYKLVQFCKCLNFHFLFLRPLGFLKILNLNVPFMLFISQLKRSVYQNIWSQLWYFIILHSDPAFLHRVFYEKIEMPDSNPWQISIISSYRDTTKPLDLYANGSSTYDLNHDWLLFFFIFLLAKLTDNIQYFFLKIYSMRKV